MIIVLKTARLIKRMINLLMFLQVLTFVSASESVCFCVCVCVHACTCAIHSFWCAVHNRQKLSSFSAGTTKNTTAELGSLILISNWFDFSWGKPHMGSTPPLARFVVWNPVHCLLDLRRPLSHNCSQDRSPSGHVALCCRYMFHPRMAWLLRR